MNSTRAKTTVVVGLLIAAALTGCSSSKSTATVAPSSTVCKPAHSDVQTLTKGTLQVSVYVSPPYSAQDGTSFSGVDPTIVKALAKLECLTLNEQPVSGAALIAGIQAKRADLGIGGIYYTADRAQTLSLSIPMYADGMALLSKSTLSGSLVDLKNKRVGVIQGYLWNAELQKALGTGNVKVYQASDGMITDLQNGRLDVAVLTSAEAGFRAKKDPTLLVTQIQSTPKITASQSKNNVVLAIVKDEASLTTALNADIKTLLSDGTIKSALSDNGMDPNLAGGTTP